jgi:hypothetical protein
MLIEIHDVDHGACIVITGPTGRRLMLDCGLNRTRGWSPSAAYRDQRIDTLMMTNLDEDHVEDLEQLWRDTQIGALVSNPTVTGDVLRALKLVGGMDRGVHTATALLDHFGSGLVGDWWNDLGGVAWQAFWNRYGWDFTDTNNLSLAVFVSFEGVTALFGGDLECAGWRRLLEIPAFRARLPEVQIFVASHHGRESGQCPELFNHMRPEVVIVSDGPKQYQSQETQCWYAQRTIGIPDYERPAGPQGQSRRRVMTTRRDGALRIDVGKGRYMVRTEPPASVFDDAARLLTSPPQLLPTIAWSGLGL